MNATIHFPRSVQEEVEVHCFSRVDAEVGGFLIGRIDDEGTHVTAAHAALAAQSGQTHLTFTHDAWDEILPVLESDYPGQAIVGWYHSHPGFGVFLSEYDIFIQENFFGADGQIALVVDPLAGTYGFLTARGGEAREEELGNTLREPLSRPGEDKADFAARVSEEEAPRMRWMPAIIVALAVGIIAAAAGWFVGSLQGRDQAKSSAQERIDDLQVQVCSLEQQLIDAGQPTPAPSTSPEPTPSPEPAPTVAPSPPGPQPGDTVTVTVEHVLSPGETLWSLASAYLGAGELYTEIEKANPGIDPAMLQDGQIIIIPIQGNLTASDGGA